MKFLPLFIAVLALADYLLAQTLTCPTGGSVTGTYTSASTSSTITWKTDCTAQTVAITGVFTASTGWISIGWNTNGQMAPADTVFAWIGGTTQYVIDSSTSGYSAPTQDATNNLVAATITRKGTTTTLAFTRAWLTTDAGDIAFNASAKMQIILAVGAAAPTGNVIGNAAQHTATDSSAAAFFNTANVASTTKAATATTTGTATGKTGADAACSAGASFSGSYKSTDGTFSLAWVISCDANTFSGIMTAKGTGWVAFGINSNTQMAGADVLQVGVTGTTPTAVDGHCTGNAQPVKAATNIYTQVNGSDSGGVTTVGFTRPLTPTTEQTITSAGSTLLWAYHATSDDLTQFHSAYSSASVNFFTGETATSTNLTLVHGSVMVLAWGFLAIFGTFFARYLKGIGHLWYQAHLALQYSVFILTVIGLIVVEKEIGSTGVHFASAHAVLGILIVAGTFIQVALGILSNKMWTPDRDGIPAFPDQIHWWLGRSVILFSVINIFMGFDLYGFTQTDYGPVISFGFWIAIVYIVYLIVDMSMGPGLHEHKHDGPPNPTRHEVYVANKTPINATAVMAFLGVILFAVTIHQINS